MYPLYFSGPSEGSFAPEMQILKFHLNVKVHYKRRGPGHE